MIQIIRGSSGGKIGSGVGMALNWVGFWVGDR